MLLSHHDIMQTVDMISNQHLDIRTVTMGITLLDCADPNPRACANKIYDKICRCAQNLVPTGERIERELGIPIVNKRISVTPIALVGNACEANNFTPLAKALDRAAKNCGVNFIGGFSALVQKGMTSGDRRLIESIPEALACTDIVCSSVNVGSTKAGINNTVCTLIIVFSTPKRNCLIRPLHQRHGNGVKSKTATPKRQADGRQNEHKKCCLNERWCGTSTIHSGNIFLL